MAVVQSYLPSDPLLIDKIVYELKSQGIFDQFRKECISDVDTKPAYQNLRQRVEGSVSGFLSKQTWSPDMNKNQVREMLRKNIYESGFLETGVERIVDQVVNPKINSVFLPKVTEIVYKFLGIERPNNEEVKYDSVISFCNTNSLLPTDLEAVSPESESNDKRNDRSKDFQILDSSKNDDDESPPFEPIEEQSTYLAQEENSVDSHLSGLVSHDSNPSPEMSKSMQIDEEFNQDSVISKHSSDGQMSIVMTDDTETKMEICEDSHLSKSSKTNDSNSKNFDFSHQEDSNKSCTSAKIETKSETKSDERSKSDRNKCHEKHKSRHESKSDSKDRREDKDRRSDRDKRDCKEKRNSKEHNSMERDKKRDSKDCKDSKSSSKSDKDRESKSYKDKDSKSEKDRYSKSDIKSDKDNVKSSSSNRHSGSGSSSKDKSTSKKESSSKDKDRVDRSRSKDKSKSSSSRDHKESKSKDDKTRGESKSHSKHDSKSDKHKKDEKHHSKSGGHSSSSKGRDKEKKDSKKDKKESKDDHFSSKKRSDRRSTDRDSNDGQSGLKSSTSSFDSYFSSQTQSKSQESSNSTSNTGSGESGTSDALENEIVHLKTPITFVNEDLESMGEVFINTEIQATIPRLKLIKPKFASNIHEARRLKKIRKQLTKIERQNVLEFANVLSNTENYFIQRKIMKDGPKETPNNGKQDRKPNILKRDTSTGKVTKHKNLILNAPVKVDIPKQVSVSEKNTSDPMSPPLKSSVVSAASWDALEAKFNQTIDYSTCYGDPNTPEKPSTPEKPIEVIDDSTRDCLSFNDEMSPLTERYVKFVAALVNRLEAEVAEPARQKVILSDNNLDPKIPVSDIHKVDIENGRKTPNKKTFKRKLIEFQSDARNNNKRFNNHHIEVHESFSLPLSPAESDKSVDKKSDISESSEKSMKKNDVEISVKVRKNNIKKALLKTQRYSSEELYKPRPFFSGSRRRTARNLGID